MKVLHERDTNGDERLTIKVKASDLKEIIEDRNVGMQIALPQQDLEDTPRLMQVTLEIDREKTSRRSGT